MHAEVHGTICKRPVYDRTVERTTIPGYLSFYMAVNTDMLPVVLSLVLALHM